MQYILNFSLVIIVFSLLAACSNGEDQKAEGTVDNDSPVSDSSLVKISPRDLLRASLEGNLETIKKAVDQDIDIDEQDQTGRIPLMLAAYNGHAEVVRYLLENDTDLTTSDNQGRTPLIFAASGSNPETVELLLENGADPNTTDQKEEWSPLMWAAAEGNYQVVSVLLEHGADPTLQDNDNETARDFAAQNNHTRIVELLKQAEDK